MELSTPSELTGIAVRLLGGVFALPCVEIACQSDWNSGSFPCSQSSGGGWVRYREALVDWLAWLGVCSKIVGFCILRVRGQIKR